MKWLKSLRSAGQKAVSWGKKAGRTLKGFGKKAMHTAEQLGVRDVLEDAGKQVGQMGMDAAKEGLASGLTKHAGMSQGQASRIASQGVGAIASGNGSQLGAMARQQLRSGVQAGARQGVDALRRRLGRR